MIKSKIILLLLALFFSYKAYTQESEGSKTIMIVGVNITGPNSRLSSLPGVKAECDSIAALAKKFNQIILTGEDANYENVVLGLKKSPTILHFSGHSIRSKDRDDTVFPLYSEDQLIFITDKDSVKKMSTLDIKNLKNYCPNGIDLVVLSTNKSYRPDVIASLKEANANSAILSVWDVEDDATKILMTEFYRNYLSGKSKQESLKLAQQYLRNYTDGEKDYSDPKYWAAFILLDALN